MTFLSGWSRRKRTSSHSFCVSGPMMYSFSSCSGVLCAAARPCTDTFTCPPHTQTATHLVSFQRESAGWLGIGGRPGGGCGGLHAREPRPQRPSWPRTALCAAASAGAPGSRSTTPVLAPPHTHAH
eukprot:3368034-Rhodomonas_salina.1